MQANRSQISLRVSIPTLFLSFRVRGEMDAILAEMRSMRADIQMMGRSIDEVGAKLDEHARCTESRLDELRTELNTIKLGGEGMEGKMESAMSRTRAGTDAVNASIRTMESSVKALATRVERLVEEQVHVHDESARKKRRLDASPREGRAVGQAMEIDLEHPASAHVARTGVGTDMGCNAEVQSVAVKCTQAGFIGLRLITNKLGAQWPQLVCGKKLLSRGVDCLWFAESFVDKDVNLDDFGSRAWAVHLVSIRATICYGVFSTLQSARARVDEVQFSPDAIDKRELELDASFQIYAVTIVDEFGAPSCKFPSII